MPEVLRFISEYRYMIYGLIIIIMMAVRPQGLIDVNILNWLKLKTSKRRQKHGTSSQKACKNFGGLSALSDVSFSINQGEIFGLIGPNGAGKTTMFNLITSMFTPTSGEIIFNEDNINGLKPHLITKKGICRTFQNIRLFPQMTAEENVMVGEHCRSKSGVFSSVFRTKSQRQEEERIRSKANELLEFVGLGGFAETVSDSLAYGQQRRLEIARALASTPKLLLLDEPAAGMNETETSELFQLIKKFRNRALRSS